VAAGRRVDFEKEHITKNGVAGAFACCYLVIAMAIEKRKLERPPEETAEIIEEHLGRLPPAEAKAMLKAIHKLAVKVSRES
jgi:hypothetical protein